MKSKEEGSITLEAALALPFLIAFVFALIAVIRISIAEASLQNVVSEVTKQVASHMFPAVLLYDQWNQTAAGAKIDEAIEQSKKARDILMNSGQWIDNYSAFIPDDVYRVLKWAADGGRQAGETAEKEMNELLNRAFHPAVQLYIERVEGEHAVLNADDISVQRVILPGLGDNGKSYFGLEVQYSLKLFIPFIDKRVLIRKKAMERIWVGM